MQEVQFGVRGEEEGGRNRRVLAADGDFLFDWNCPVTPPHHTNVVRAAERPAAGGVRWLQVSLFCPSWHLKTRPPQKVICVCAGGHVRSRPAKIKRVTWLTSLGQVWLMMTILLKYLQVSSYVVLLKTTHPPVSLSNRAAHGVSFNPLSKLSERHKFIQNCS